MTQGRVECSAKYQLQATGYLPMYSLNGRQYRLFEGPANLTRISGRATKLDLVQKPVVSRTSLWNLVASLTHRETADCILSQDSTWGPAGSCYTTFPLASLALRASRTDSSQIARLSNGPPYYCSLEDASVDGGS